MASYLEKSNYYELVSSENLLVSHNVNDQKKFFRMDIEELFSAVRDDLPGFDAGPFVIMINYVTEQDYAGRPIEKNENMLYFLQGYEDGNYEQELIARDNSEKAKNQFLRRFKKDSENGDGIFDGDFDVIKAKSTPQAVYFNANYVGWSCIYRLVDHFDECYNEDNWI